MELEFTDAGTGLGFSFVLKAYWVAAREYWAGDAREGVLAREEGRGIDRNRGVGGGVLVGEEERI